MITQACEPLLQIQAVSQGWRVIRNSSASPLQSDPSIESRRKEECYNFSWSRMATQPGLWTDYPWQSMGNWKYLLYVPVAAKVIFTQYLGGSDHNNFYLHMLILAATRYLVGQIGVSLSRWRYLIGTHEIQKKGITFATVDHSSNWEDYILLNTLLLVLAYAVVPQFASPVYPVWNNTGLLICLLMHIGPAEFVYYWAHRALHHHFLFTRYHSHHHTLFITEANSGTVHPFAEHILYAVIFAIPIIGTWALGGMSVVGIYFYPLFIDIFNAIGHCNFEFFPKWVFHTFPLLKYFIYTPSYHSLHHSQVHTNFCLFMPLYDYLGGTMDKNSDALYHSVRSGTKEKSDFVYLTHGTELLHMFHIVLGIQSFSAMPYSAQWFVWPLYPLAILVMGLLWVFGKPFVADKYRLPANSLQGETWVMPRYSFQYSLPSDRKRINKLIENAIRMAEKDGVRVISLGTLNKGGSLNGGGLLFVAKNPTLRIRIVTGDTLTASIVLDRLPKDVQEVFLIGSSEVSRAIAIYLCRRNVRVLMLVPRAQFERIQLEIPKENQRCLVHVTKYQAGQQCPVWILGKSADAKDQMWAPAGTHFHQLTAAEPLVQARKDCTYVPLPALQVPSSIKGLRTCEISMPREVVHACHAGGLIHTLENWDHHEVGPIDVDKLDKVWEAALKHGFQRV